MYVEQRQLKLTSSRAAAQNQAGIGNMIFKSTLVITSVYMYVIYIGNTVVLYI